MLWKDLQAVPVLPTASKSTFMGTVRFWPRLSVSVSLVKTSVMGLREYVSAKHGNIWPFSMDAILTNCDVFFLG